jgi:hypothetical protein
MNPIIPDPEMKAQALSCLEYANSYFDLLKKSVAREKSRFDNDLLYQLAVMSLEKYFVGLLARYDWNATHHMPLALFKEAEPLEPELTDAMKETARKVGQFESICSLDGFGYKTPTRVDLSEIVTGLESIKLLVEKRIQELD